MPGTANRWINDAGAARQENADAVALAAAGRLEHTLAGYHPYQATRAGLLRRLGRRHKPRAPYDKAIELAGDTTETACLTRRRDQLG